MILIPQMNFIIRNSNALSVTSNSEKGARGILQVGKESELIRKLYHNLV